MRYLAPTPTHSSLPLSRARAANHLYPALPLALSNEAIVRFNDLLHELYPDAPRIDADAIASLAHWLQSQSPQQREYLLQARLNRIAELQALRNDSNWPLEPAQAKRLDKLLGYIDENNDLIPDDMPVFGRLDDVLLLELAWPILADELDDYHDFCHFCEEIGSDKTRSPTQQDWICTRWEEGALWEQLHRVRDQHYVEYQSSDALFRVS